MTNSTSTAPTPAPLLGNYITWLKAHEKLLLVAVGAFLLFHFYDRGLSAWQAHDEFTANKAAQQVKTDQISNADIQAQLAQLVDTVGKQQQAITAIIAKRQVVTVQQKQKDAQMTPSELAARFQGLLKVGQADVTSLEPSGNLVFTLAAGQANINQLEDLQQCTQDRVDLKTELASEVTLVGKQTDALAGVQKELADEKVSHVADVKLEKAKSHHTAVKWFKIGIIVGAVGTEAVRIWAGHP